MHKRGSERLWMTLIELVLVLMTYFALKSFVDRAASDMTLERNYVTRQLAFLISTAYGAPGTLSYTYMGNTFFFTMNFSKNLVTVYDTAGTGINYNQASWHYFLEDKAIDFVYATLYPDFPHGDPDERNQVVPQIIKTEDQIEVRKRIEGAPNLLTCPNIDTKDEISTKRIMIDPAHGGDDTGHWLMLPDPYIFRREMAESNITLSAAINITEALRGVTNTELTRSDDTTATLEQRQDLVKASAPDALVTLHVAKAEPGKSYIKVYVSDNSTKTQQSKKLACLIINRVLTTEEFRHLYISDINFIEIVPEEEYAMLNLSDVAVYVEFGNTEGSPGLQLAASYEPVGKAIAQGIRDYYEGTAPVMSSNAQATGPITKDTKVTTFVVSLDRDKGIAQLKKFYEQHSSSDPICVEDLDEFVTLLYDIGVAYGIDPAFAAGVTTIESTWLTHKGFCQCHNYFGHKASPLCSHVSGFKQFASDKESIEAFYKNIKENFIPKGQDSPHTMVAPSLCKADSSQPCCNIDGSVHCYCCDTPSQYTSWIQSTTINREKVGAT